MLKRGQLKKQAQKKKTWKRFLFLVLLLIFLGGLSYLVFFFPKFQVRGFEFSGNKNTKREKLESFARDFQKESFFNKNIFTFCVQKMSAELTEEFPDIKSVAIKRKWPDVLQLTLTERKETAVFCPAWLKKMEPEEIVEGAEKTALSQANFWENVAVGNCFFVDEEGVAFLPASLIVGGKFSNILVVSEEADFLGRQALTPSMISLVQETRQGLEGRGLNPVKFLFRVEEKELRVLTGGAWTLLFDTGNNIQKQLVVLERTLAEELKNQTGNLDYIDLRVSGRAYYKLK